MPSVNNGPKEPDVGIKIINSGPIQSNAAFKMIGRPLYQKKRELDEM